MSYDANGNVASRLDFNGNQTCYANDMTRNLELTRVEGLASSATCTGLTSTGATLPAGSRMINTTWHPQWRLKTRVAEPGKITTYVYNGQPDPTNNGAIVNCVGNLPGSTTGQPTLPDGSLLALLCRQVEQATTDTDGHLGLGAALDTSVAARSSSYTYDGYGHVLTATDALGNVTAYSYYQATSSFSGTGANAAGQTLGDLQSVTVAAGTALSQTTTYELYNPYGQVLHSTDPNGVVTTNTYDPRQRLLSTTVGSETTQFGYDPVGQLTTVTPPNGATLTYSYDPAHRLTQIQDAAGNAIKYTLDASGNRTGEQVQDPSGVLARNISRSFDALNRVQSVTGAMQ